VDFNLSEREKMIQSTARDFAVKEVLPRAAEIDRTAEFPSDLVRQMVMMGYFGLAYRAAFLRDQGQCIRNDSAVAKFFCSQMAVEVTRMAMQVRGAYGTMKTLPVERLYRDAKMTEVYVGVSEIQRAIIASHLVK
jgi:alkylation response protein AidB-like acyl-CoA dehydrogenase